MAPFICYSNPLGTGISIHSPFSNLTSLYATPPCISSFSMLEYGRTTYFLRCNFMKTAGIIAEYNPFHTGHEYQINYIKEKLRTDYIVIAMSGDFVQRGTPALFQNMYVQKWLFGAAQTWFWSCRFPFLLPVQSYLPEEAYSFWMDLGLQIYFVSEVNAVIRMRLWSWPKSWQRSRKLFRTPFAGI